MKTQEQEIVTVLAELVPDGGTALARRVGPQALAHAQAIQGEIVPWLEANELTARAWQAFQQSPQAQKPKLLTVVQLILDDDVDLAARLDALLRAYQQAQPAGKQETRTVTASGERSVAIGGNARGNTFNTGDQIQTLQPGLDADAVTRLFAQALDLARQQPVELREDVAAAVETAQEEVAAGPDADKALLNKMLDVLLDKAPDVLELVVEAILNPAAAVGKGAKLLAKQARESLQKQRSA